MNTARKAEVEEREKAQKAQKLAERRQREAETQKSIAIEQRTAAEQATAKEKEQTVIAQQATQRAEKEAKLATLRGQAASGLYWLSTAYPAFGVALAIDAMDRSQSVSEVEVVAQSVLMKSIHWVQEINLLKGHQSEVWSVSFSPDGKRIVSGSSDKTVRIWDTKTGQPVGEPLQGHQDFVLSVAFSPDGQRIVSGSRDKTVRIWEVGPEELTQLACDRFRLHPLLHQPDKVTSDPSIIEAANRSKVVCKQHFPAWDSYRASQPGFPNWLFSHFQQLLADWLKA